MSTLRPGGCSSVYISSFCLTLGVMSVKCCEQATKAVRQAGEGLGFWLKTAVGVKLRPLSEVFWPATKSATGDRVSNKRERQRHIITTPS